jgi:hypothetical protein
MKRKGASRSTIAKYLTTFMELHDEITRNPRTKRVKEIIRKNRSGNHPFTMLKKSGVVVKSKNGLEWTGEKPSVNMVIQVTEMIHKYKLELSHRKKSEGDMFRRKRKSSFRPTPVERTLASDEQITISSGQVDAPIKNEDWLETGKKLFCKDVQEIEQKKLSEINPEELQKWKESYLKNTAEQSEIPIRTPVDQSMVSEFIDHHAPVAEKPSLNWFQKFIKLIFRIQ